MTTIIIPAYNEEKIIYKNVEKIYNTLNNCFDFDTYTEIIVLDDGSTDNTKKEIKKLIKKYKYIKYVYMPGPSRRENLIKYMISCKSSYVGFMDCDLATDLKDLKNLIKFSSYYDIVSGSRYVTSSVVNRCKMRKVISFCFNNCIRLFFGSKIRDHECGFKIFKTSSLKKIVEKTGIDNKDRKMFWDSEMWIYAQDLKLKVLEIPITWTEGKKSALRFKTELSMIKYALKLWLKRTWMKKN